MTIDPQTQTSAVLVEGALLARRYRLVAGVGEPGERAWRARDTHLDLDVRVDVRDAHELGAPAVDRLRAVLSAATAVSSPSVARVLDIGSDPPGDEPAVLFVVSEFADGPSLETTLRRLAPFSPSETGRLLDEILAGLQVVHDRALPLGRLSARDIVVGESGARIALGPVVLACATERRSHETSPEILGGAEPTVAADVFSVGCIGFEALAGRPPFPDGGGSVTASGPPPFELAEAADPLAAAVLRALEPVPAHRHADAASFALALRQPPTAPLSTTPEPEPDTITPEPDTATPEPDTATPEPDTATRDPEPLPAVVAHVAEPHLARRAGAGWSRVALSHAVAGWGLSTRALRGAAHVLRSVPPGVALALAAVAAIAYLSARPDALRPAPDLEGLTLDHARVAAHRSGLAVTPVEVERGGVSGVVVGQQPRAGRAVAGGAAIRVEVTRGAPQVVVPKVSGMSVEEAIRTLRASNLDAGADVTYEVGTGQRPGRVARTRPAAAEQVDAGTSIEVVAAPPTGDR